MASAPGASIRDAYGSKAPLKPRETPGEFVPKSSAGLKAELASNAAAVAKNVKEATSGDPFAKRPGGELPGFPKGGRKSRRRVGRRRKTRRGGALKKTPRELRGMLAKEKGYATEEDVRNVLSELKDSEEPELINRANAIEAELDAPLAAGEEMEGAYGRAGKLAVKLHRILYAVQQGHPIPGGRRKTTRRR